MKKPLDSKPAENRERDYEIDQLSDSFVLIFCLTHFSILSFLKLIEAQEDEISKNCDCVVDRLHVAYV